MNSIIFKIFYIIIILLSIIYSIYIKSNNLSIDKEIVIKNDDNFTLDINLSKYTNKKANDEKHIIILLRDNNID